MELHEQARKKGTILINDYSSFSPGTFKNEILEEIENVKCNDLEDLVYRFQLTYDETVDKLDLKLIATKRKGFFLNPGIYEITDINKTLGHILPDKVKVSITIDDIRLKSTFKFIQFLISTNKSFYSFLSFTQSHFSPLDDIEGFYQLIAVSYKSDTPVMLQVLGKFI